MCNTEKRAMNQWNERDTNAKNPWKRKKERRTDRTIKMRVGVWSLDGDIGILD